MSLNRRPCYVSLLLTPLIVPSLPAQDAVTQSELDRVLAVQRVKPTVVAVFDKSGQGGGTGVVISPEGYALTNFHVVQPCGPTMKCGLADGVLYDAVLVSIDKVGDVALIKLLAPSPDFKFPHAVLGNSDLMREGDWSIAMGNPFLLATDFTPTVTFGLVSGVHRYQYPSGSILEYTDCLQVDASINPGNSGGPLFNLKGELIGINGRGSFDKRGRINSGVGYAISINQIKNFLGHLMAGIEVDHASLGALVSTLSEESGLSHMKVTTILEDADVYRRGLDVDDELVSFAGRPMSSVNQYKNVLGIFPRGWRVPLEFRREGSRKEILVRLMGALPKEVGKMAVLDKDVPGKDGPAKPPAGPEGPGAKFYDPKPGFTNHYFNRLEKDRLMTAFAKHGDFSTLADDWTIEGVVRLKKLTSESATKIDIKDEHIRLGIDGIPYTLEPLKEGQGDAALSAPEGTGGLLAALWAYKLLLIMGEKGFTGGDFHHGGHEPIYPPPVDRTVTQKADWRIDAEVINARVGPYLVKYFFALSDQKCLGFELRVAEENADPCEVFLDDYRPVAGRLLPYRMQVTHADGHYGTFLVTNWRLPAAK